MSVSFLWSVHVLRNADEVGNINTINFKTTVRELRWKSEVQCNSANTNSVITNKYFSPKSAVIKNRFCRSHIVPCNRVYMKKYFKMQSNVKYTSSKGCVNQGTLNRGSVGWQMSTCFSCFYSAIGIMKKKTFCFERNHLF